MRLCRLPLFRRRIPSGIELELEADADGPREVHGVGKFGAASKCQPTPECHIAFYDETPRQWRLRHLSSKTRRAASAPRRSGRRPACASKQHRPRMRRIAPRILAHGRVGRRRLEGEDADSSSAYNAKGNRTHGHGIGHRPRHRAGGRRVGTTSAQPMAILQRISVETPRQNAPLATLTRAAVARMTAR